jgi:prefoldin subunit 5
MWQIEPGGNVSYKPMIPEVNTRTGEIYSPEQIRKMQLQAKNSAYDFVSRQLKGQSFVWVEVGTGDPDAETTQRQIKRGTKKGTFKVTTMQPSTTYPVTVTQGTPKSPEDINKSKRLDTRLETNKASDANLKNLENATVDKNAEARRLDYEGRKKTLNKELNLSRSHMLAREELRKSAVPEVEEFINRGPASSDNPPKGFKGTGGKPPKEKPRATKEEVAAAKKKAGLTIQEEIDRKFKGRTIKDDSKVVLNKYTPAKPSTEAEVKKAIDSLDSNIEKLKKIIDKQPINSRTEETAKSLKRIEYMKLVKEAEYKDLMSRRSKQRTGTLVRPPSVDKLKEEAKYLSRRLDKIDEAIKENTDKLKEIKKYEYGKAAPREKLVKVIESHRQDKKFAMEALKVVLLILTRKRIP